MRADRFGWAWYDRLGAVVLLVVIAASIAWTAKDMFQVIATYPSARVGDCGVRISSRGRAHSPDSIYYGLVSDDAPCFATMAEAEAAGYVGVRE
jgi:hypothetical protein